MEQYVIVKRKQFNRSKVEYIFGFDSEAFNGMAGFNQLNLIIFSAHILHAMNVPSCHMNGPEHYYHSSFNNAVLLWFYYPIILSFVSE